jgi:hypothetical protein
MKLRCAWFVAASILLPACAAVVPVTHPTGGPFCFVGYAGYFSEPRFIAVSRAEAHTMELEGRSFLVAYFDERGLMTSLRSCYKGKCAEPMVSAGSVNGSSGVGPEQCPVSPPQRSVTARASRP